MEDTTVVQVFRCSTVFQENLMNCARLRGVDNSTYCRWAISVVNRMVNQKAAKDDI
jgi:hypothetical protein